MYSLAVSQTVIEQHHQRFPDKRAVQRLASTVYSHEGRQLMNVLVCTDGKSDIDTSARFAYALAGSEGSATVLTVVPIPRQLVSQLREQWGETPTSTTDVDAEYVGAPGGIQKIARSFPGDDAVIEQYLGNKRIELCKPVVEAIRELGGAAASDVREGHEIAAGIMEVAQQIKADVIVIGSHGHGGFQGLLGSTGSKLVRRAKRPVLVLR